jgi:hypothetical protein
MSLSLHRQQMQLSRTRILGFIINSFPFSTCSAINIFILRPQISKIRHGRLGGFFRGFKLPDSTEIYRNPCLSCLVKRVMRNLHSNSRNMNSREQAVFNVIKIVSSSSTRFWLTLVGVRPSSRFASLRNQLGWLLRLQTGRLKLSVVVDWIMTIHENSEEWRGKCGNAFI